MSSDKQEHDVEDLRERMKQVQRKSKRRAQSEPLTDNQTLRQTKEIILSVVTKFIEGDSSLMLQSSPSNHVFLSCGLTHVCRLSINANEDDISITMQSNSTNEIYSGTFDEAKVETSVKTALFQWYTSLFSS